MPEYEPIKQVIYTVDELLNFFKLEENPKIFDRVDNIIIQFPNQRIHLGIICYNNVKFKYDKRFKKLYAIPSSLDFEKVKITKLLLKHINDLLIDGVQPITINGRLKVILNFIEHLKINNIELKLNRTSFQIALVSYSQLLLHQIKIYNKELGVGLKTGTAHNYQKWVLSFSSFILNVDCLELLNSDDFITTNDSERIPTQALSNEEQSVEFNQYTTLFRRFSSIVLNHEMFPLRFELHKQQYWINHTGKIAHNDNENLKKSGIFNFKEGRKYSRDEIISSRRYKNTSKRNEAIKLFRQINDKANIHNSAARLFIALYACRAYFMHFLFLTGENDSTAASLLFNSNYMIENSEVNFKSIKWRANGIPVKYDIQSEFIEDFKAYLRLRSFVLKQYNEKHNELFFDLLNNQLIAAPNDGKYSSLIRFNASRIFKENDFIATSKTIRVTKGLWIRSKHGSSLSAYILQHSEKASTSNYTSSNFEESSEDLTNYFNKLTNQLIVSPGIEKATPCGKCIEPHKPKAISEVILSDTVTIDCRDQTTCLFCNKYRIHADEKDIRKLLSMKYLIIQSEYLAASIEHFKNVYELTLTHIEVLLDQIKAQGKEQEQLIIDINQQVFEHENLSNYWYRKLELLNELGVI